MSTVESITSTVADSSTTAATRVPKQVLGQEDFLKLLAVQFASQDPLKPMEDTAFIAQMANFSALDLQNSMSASLANLSSSQQLYGAQSLLGKIAEVLDTEGSPISGLVTSVRTDGENTMLTINDREYDFASVRRVQLNDNPGNPQP
ncbi:MAG: flagellar hook assembly protein FlgD [Verrucomicrobia bacterium]|nr:MAG: flagellar hook assembly protein FlgD [Verrucomicrobiota bacterium]